MDLCGRYETHALIGNVDSYVLRMFTQENPGADGSLVRALSFRSPRECRWAREARPGAIIRSHSPTRSASAQNQPIGTSLFVEFLVVII